MEVENESDQLSIFSTQENATKGDVTAAAVEQRWIELDYRCELTGVKMTPQTVSMDHLQPLCNGGDHIMSNLQFVTKEANRMKGTLSQHDFIAICRQVVAWKG